MWNECTKLNLHQNWCHSEVWDGWSLPNALPINNICFFLIRIGTQLEIQMKMCLFLFNCYCNYHFYSTIHAKVCWRAGTTRRLSLMLSLSAFCWSQRAKSAHYRATCCTSKRRIVWMEHTKSVVQLVQLSHIILGSVCAFLLIDCGVFWWWEKKSDVMFLLDWLNGWLFARLFVDVVVVVAFI